MLDKRLNKKYNKGVKKTLLNFKTEKEKKNMKKMEILYTIETVTEAIKQMRLRSCWDRGVRDYAVELLENNITEFVEYEGRLPYNEKELVKILLNGSDDWKHYSESGCALIMDKDIAARLCTPTELKITNFGLKNPNKTETWIDVQARALKQASIKLIRVFNGTNLYCED